MQPTRCVGVLGGLRLKPPDRLSGIGRRVIAHLAVRGPRELRGLVCGELWPDIPDERARANLRRALWQLPTGWVVVEGPDLVLDAVVDLSQARDAAKRALQGDKLSWDQVEALARDLLPGWCEDWVVAEQESFGLLRVQALEVACRHATAAGDHALATHAGFRAVQSDPLRESAVVALVEAHLAEGNRDLALRRYSAYAQLLGEELHTRPGQTLEHLVRVANGSRWGDAAGTPTERDATAMETAAARRALRAHNGSMRQ